MALLPPSQNRMPRQLLLLLRVSADMVRFL